MTGDLDLSGETGALLQYFEERGFDSVDACSVMGMALTAIIAEQQEAELFIQTLRKSFAAQLGTRQ